MHNLVTWVYPFGEDDKEYREKMCDFIKNGIIYNDNFLESRERFEEKIRKYFPLELNTFCYGVSGSEAIEHGLMIAENLTGKHKFLYFSGGYHGSSTTLLNLTYKEKYSRECCFEFEEITPPYCYRCSKKCGNYKCIQDLFNNIGEENEIAAFIIDPSFGNILLDVDVVFFKRIAKECRDRKILVIFDEIRTGFGRLGYEFAYQKYDIVPDILCLSKGIACGLPLSLTIYNGRSLTDSFKREFHYMLETTFAGFELSLNMANYTLKRIHKKPDFCIENAKFFAEKLDELRKFHSVGDIRSNGMLFAIEFIHPSNGKQSRLRALLFASEVRKRNVIINNPAYSSVILLHPSLNISKREIEEIVNIFKECMKIL